MRRLLLKVAILAFAGIAYAISPFVTAWNIREAAKSGDAAYLSQKFEWDRVRETLKDSLATAALDLPAAAPGEAVPAQKPTLWQRFKAYWGKGAVNRVVENYASAEGLPKLFAYRQTYRDAVGHVEPPKTVWNLPERLQKAWTRVRRAEFTSFTRFEMEMVDKGDENRLFAGVMEFTGLEWKVVSLHVHSLKPQSATGGVSSSPRGLFSMLRAAAVPKRLAARDEETSPMER